ncbi:MAG: ADP-heptose--lipooligosaccharide heptosyltransferase II [uncultured Segetibacter sp.]|uniref:ADP-heptose--lipooligosaccharide heptosyltransferase II n=1 Tax=uncultured Segetibacter sp. TaxID=481133 RepID=A0A6J4TVF4_9BACT|nr:MAG: ADP-heptose--lipooligosaccharide heptosyltransferase II [uncultured Segetibacter sp.]
MSLSRMDTKKIVIFRALQLGDLLCAIPAIRALHKTYPAAEITLVGLPWAKMLTQRFDKYFHSFISFPGYPGLPEQAPDFRSYPDFLKNVQQQNFDLALQMQGKGAITNPLVQLFAAKKTAGFYKTGNYCPDKELFIPYPDRVHEIKRHLRLMEHLGVKSDSTDLEFPVTAEDEEDFEKAQLPVQPGEYIIIHPGARSETRQWSPENFGAAADYCIKKGLRAVITGTKDEKEIVQKVLKSMRHKAIDATGKTTLGAVAVLIKNAHGLISNCTGVAHIAAALRTKSIVLTLHQEHGRWEPLNKTLHRAIGWTTNADYNDVIAEIDHIFFKN